MKHSIIISLITLLLSSTAASQTTVKVDMLKNGWIAINGTTNLISFKLVHSGEKLLEKSTTFNITQNKNKLYLDQNQLVLQAKNFASDNPMALRDFMKLIQATKYPTIKVQLNHIEITPTKENEPYTKGTISINITLTGVSRQYNIPFTTKNNSDKIHIEGSKKFSIRDFGLEPPVEMLGMIRVSEWISIDFKLNCKFSTNTPTFAIQQ